MDPILESERRLPSDIARDIRGMAIKLMGVPGEKLLEEEKHEQTQDFIVISTNVFVTKDVEEFDQLIRALTGSMLSKIGFFATHAGRWNLIESMNKYANPLQIRYWSTTPYLLGTNAVKYSAIPHVHARDEIPANPGDDFLAKRRSGNWPWATRCSTSRCNCRSAPRRCPSKTPGKAWDETVSPFRKVATIRIPKQEFDGDRQREFGEHLSYSPWHSLPEHRPLGGVNRARKVVSTRSFRRSGIGRIRRRGRSRRVGRFEREMASDTL